MKNLLSGVKSYLARPESGAGLMYVALALVIVKLWLTRLVSGAGLSGGLAFYWTLVSFVVAAWLAFLLLRRRLPQRSLRRVLLVAAVHAVGALRFYDWGLMLLSTMPLFALLPALLLPPEPRS